MKKISLAAFSAIAACVIAVSSMARAEDWATISVTSLKSQVRDVSAQNRRATASVLNAGPVTSANRVICIDPGHPSEKNDGAQLQQGLREVTINWQVGLELEKILRDKGFTVVKTKDAERQFVKNKDRAITANNAKAALSIRLHCDTGSHNGYAIYYPDRQGTVDGVTGPSSGVREASRKLAQAVEKGMAAGLVGKLKDRGVKGDSQTAIGSQQGALTGSIYSEVPVVTVEMVVLSDKNDAAFIGTAEGRRQMAQSLADGLLKY